MVPLRIVIVTKTDPLKKSLLKFARPGTGCCGGQSQRNWQSKLYTSAHWGGRQLYMRAFVYLWSSFVLQWTGWSALWLLIVPCKCNLPLTRQTMKSLENLSGKTVKPFLLTDLGMPRCTICAVLDALASLDFKLSVSQSVSNWCFSDFYS